MRDRRAELASFLYLILYTYEKFGLFVACSSNQIHDVSVVNCTTGFAFPDTSQPADGGSTLQLDTLPQKPKLWTDPSQLSVCFSDNFAEPVLSSRNETTGDFRLTYRFNECNPSTNGR